MTAISRDREPVVGDLLGPLVVRVTRDTAVQYAGASGDFNPIHYSDRRAADVGLAGVIVHGMWTMGAALRLVTEWCGDARRVRTYSVRFTRPVVLPDDDRGVDLVVTGEVTGVTDTVVTIALEARVGEEKVLGNGRVEVSR